MAIAGVSGFWCDSTGKRDETNASPASSTQNPNTPKPKIPAIAMSVNYTQN